MPIKLERLTIKNRWKVLETDLTNKGAPALQVSQMRFAFYAGVAAMMEIHQILATHNVTENDALAVIHRVVDEMTRFMAETEDALSEHLAYRHRSPSQKQ